MTDHSDTEKLDPKHFQCITPHRIRDLNIKDEIIKVQEIMLLKILIASGHGNLKSNTKPRTIKRKV